MIKGAVVFAIIITVLAWCAIADANKELDAVMKLQPMHTQEVAASWAGAFRSAGKESDIDPLLLIAIAYRESSIRDDVVGKLGEQGPMQLHGAALMHRPRACNPAEMTCSIRGGAAVLQYWRSACNDDRWAVWIGAYGLGQCPSYGDAAKLRSVQRARALYEKIGGDGWI